MGCSESFPLLWREERRGSAGPVRAAAAASPAAPPLICCVLHLPNAAQRCAAPPVQRLCRMLFGRRRMPQGGTASLQLRCAALMNAFKSPFGRVWLQGCELPNAAAQLQHCFQFAGLLQAHHSVPCRRSLALHALLYAPRRQLEYPLPRAACSCCSAATPLDTRIAPRAAATLPCSRVPLPPAPPLPPAAAACPVPPMPRAWRAAGQPGVSEGHAPPPRTPRGGREAGMARAASSPGPPAPPAPWAPPRPP